MLRGKLLIILLLICNAAFAQYIDFMPVVPAVAIIVGILLGAVQMAATSLSNPRLMAWFKTELRELIGGIFLIAIIMGVFITSNTVSIALTGESDYMGVAINTIENTLTDGSIGVDRAYKDVIRAATKVKAGASYMPTLSIPLWVVTLAYTTSPYAGITPIISSLGMAAHALTNVIFIYEGLLLVLKFLAVVSPSILLPFSFCMRLIPFTRKIGNTLIAISIAAMVLLPFSIIMMGEINESVIDYPEASIGGRDMDNLDAKPWAMFIAEPFCGSETMKTIFGLTDLGFAAVICLPILLTGVGAAAYPACLTLVQYTIYPLISNIFYIVHAVILAIWLIWAETGLDNGMGGDWAETVFNTVYPFLTQVNNLVLLLYIEFVLVSILTYTGAKSISTALGGEWYMAGIQRLV
ncbi:MAG: hypothetical protein ABII71_02525 [Candidatus Micrarchaeota archaeon]